MRSHSLFALHLSIHEMPALTPAEWLSWISGPSLMLVLCSSLLQPDSLAVCLTVLAPHSHRQSTESLNAPLSGWSCYVVYIVRYHGLLRPVHWHLLLMLLAHPHIPASSNRGELPHATADLYFSLWEVEIPFIVAAQCSCCILVPTKAGPLSEARPCCSATLADLPLCRDQYKA